MPLAVLLLVAAFIGTAGSASAGAPSPESPTGLQAIPAHWFASSHDVAHGAGNAGATGGVVEATTMHPMLAPLRLPDQADAEYSEHASQDVSETALAQAMLHPTLRAATGVRGAEFDDSLQAMQNIWRDGQPTDGDAGAPAPLFNQEAVHAGAATAAVAATSANVPGEAAVADETPMATVLAPDAVPDWPPADAAATVQVQPVASSIPANAAAISDVGDERKSGAVSEAADALEAPVAMDVVLASHSLDVAAAAAAAHGVDAASAELAAPAVVAQASVDAAASDLEAQGTQWGSDPLDETRRLRRRGALRGKAQPPATNIAASTARHVVHPGRGSGKLVSADAGAWGAASAPPLARPIAALPKSVVRAAPDLPKLGGVGDGPRPGLFSSSLVWGIMVMAAGVVATVRYMLRRPARPEHRAHKPSAQLAAVEMRPVPPLKPRMPQLHGGPAHARAQGGSGSQLLSTDHVRLVAQSLPSRLSICDWKLLYTTEEHGCDLRQLYKRCRGKSELLLVAVDSAGHLFGAFSSVPLKPQNRFVGTGESFVMRLHPVPEVYKWTRDNNNFVLCRHDCLGFGGGNFALWLDGSLEHGTSAPSPTFDNVCLAGSSHFKCVAVEVWGFRPCM